MPKKGKHKGSKGFVFEVAAKCQAVCQADRCECGAALQRRARPRAGLARALGRPARTQPTLSRMALRRELGGLFVSLCRGRRKFISDGAPLRSQCL